MTWPFENNTNAITGKLAKRSLQADKRRNIFLIVTITLTTALLSGIFFTVFAEPVSYTHLSFFIKKIRPLLNGILKM